MNTRACSLGLLSLLLVCSAPPGYADSATWSTNPATGNWNTATNWMPNTVPNGPGNVATFATSTKTAVSFAADTEVDSIIFNPGASAFTLTTAPFHLLTISGAGLINNSGQTQQFVSALQEDGPIDLPQAAFNSVEFKNSSSAGSDIVYTASPGDLVFGAGGNFIFQDASSAGSAIFNIYGDSRADYKGSIEFYNSSTAANATINLYDGAYMPVTVASISQPATLANAIVNNQGGNITISGGATAGEATIINEKILGQLSYSNLTIGSNITTGIGTAGSANITNRGATATRKEGSTFFAGDAKAGVATIINEGGDGAVQAGGFVTIGSANAETPTAEAATLIANPGTNWGGGGLITFGQNSLGGTARCELFGNGTLDISPHFAPGLTIGSIEGDGPILLGARNLTVGSNNLSTTVSGVIQDGGAGGGTGGALSKIGTGVLNLSGANTYTGGTTVTAGTLVIANVTGSGTGSGAVQVNGGTLGGSGTIAGAATIGTGSGSGAFLAPATGTKTPTTLTTLSALTFKADGTLTYTLKGKGQKARGDQVVANGISIESGASFSLRGKAQVLRQGFTLTALNNTAATPIAGTFANLPDGAVITVGSSHLQANYQGGDGNDLTFTVVP